MRHCAARVASSCLLGLAVLVLGCRQGERTMDGAEVYSGPPWFEDVTEKRGLTFHHDAGPVGNYFMPQQVGSGAAFFDFDRDGRLDILLLQNGGPKGKK